jgi:hypothetical protein
MRCVCVFELSLGQPLLRHWTDAGGSPAYYGAVQGSTLVVRTMSTVYNYDYIAVSNAHAVGSSTPLAWTACRGGCTAICSACLNACSWRPYRPSCCGGSLLDTLGFCGAW